jgi:hypothetical protein
MPSGYPFAPRPAAEPLSEVSAIGMYARLLEPVVLVTEARGREGFNDTRRLFRRLEAIAATKKAGHTGRIILAIWQGDQHVADAGVLALELMLEIGGLENFDRASKAQKGGGRALRSKYQWYFLSEYLGWNWERA